MSKSESTPRKFEPTWESLRTYEIPEWYIDGKFGIFIHWGPYCVPAYSGEWYPRVMYDQSTDVFKHHVETYGPHTEFGYKDFIPQLTAENYDAKQWADLFRKSGAKFIVPVAEHHDGFAMYDSGFSDWCAARMGPKRDVIGELADAVRDAGMIFGASTHRAEHWWFMDEGRKFDSDVNDPAYAELYGPAEPKDSTASEEYLEDWLARTIEIIDKYQPKLLWFDWWIQQPEFKPYLQRLAAHYYNRSLEWGVGVAINYKYDAYEEGTAVLDIERGQLGDIRELFWQNDTSVSKGSWGYVTNHDYRTVDSIVDDLIDVVSKNGALLLNVGPKADGSIPEPEQQMLLEIGKWLAMNGEAIYNTRSWKVFGEGPTEVVEGSFTDTKRGAFTPQDIRFTINGDTLYAMALAWPGEEMVIETLSTNLRVLTQDIESVAMLGVDGPLEWTRDGNGLTVKLPPEPPCDHAHALKIVLKPRDQMATSPD